jgi:phenylalanyl-tRNA synthetase beta chain
VDGIELATKLILEVCGGEASEVVVAGKVPEGPAPVAFKPRDMKRLTGLDMAPKRMEQILRALGFEPVVPPKAQHDAETIWGDQGAVVAARCGRFGRYRRRADPHRGIR